MKSYIVITKSDWSFEVGAKSHKDAVAAGRRVCRDTGEKFVTVRMVK